MKFNWKQDLKGLLLLGLLILGVSVPTGIIVRQYNEINALQQQIKDYEYEFYDDIFELMAEVYEIDSELALREQELEYYENYMELLVDYEVANQTSRIIEEYIEEILFTRDQLLKAQYQLELAKIQHAYDLEKAYGFDTTQIMDDWEASLEIMEEYYSQPQTISYATYLYTNYPELYARILGYGW